MSGFELCAGIFMRAILAYSALTSPVFFFVEKEFYFLSLMSAFGLGVFVFILFVIGVYFLKRLRITRAYDALYLALLLLIALVYHLAGILLFHENPWDAGEFIFLPLTGGIAGWIALYVSRAKIIDYFNEDEHAQVD